MKTYRDLEVWQKSIDFVEYIYRFTNSFPDKEKYGLISQLNRYVISIPSNIAEGSARNSDKEFIRFLYISLGSLSEVETQLIIAKRLDYIDYFEFDKIDEIKKLLYGLIRY
ncbi:MAG: four helix bundle protein [Chlorobi bacterium]|nr:four helix bundle protein [Chlorobiota bacterium]